MSIGIMNILTENYRFMRYTQKRKEVKKAGCEKKNNKKYVDNVDKSVYN